MRENLSHQQPQRHAVLQRQRDGGGEAVHQARDGRALLGHPHEDLARLAGLVQADVDVALVARDRELVRERLPLVGQLAAAPPPAARSGATAGAAAHRRRRLAQPRIGLAGRQRLGALAAVAVDRDRLQPVLPGLHVGVLDVLDRARRAAG